MKEGNSEKDPERLPQVLEEELMTAIPPSVHFRNK